MKTVMKEKSNKFWWAVYFVFAALFVFLIVKSLYIGSTLEAVIFGLILLPSFFIKKVDDTVTYLFWFFIIGAYVASNPQWFDGIGLKSAIYENYKANKPQYIAEINKHIEAGKIDTARDLIFEYDDYGDPEFEKLKAKLQHKQIQVEADQITNLQKELNTLADDDYERRNELLTKITKIPLGNIYDNHQVLEENQKRWDEAKAKLGSFEDDCNSGAAKSLAHVMLQKWVKQKLISPSTAKFPWRNEIEIGVTKPCDFAINGYVDSQNQYGAMIRSFYKAKLRRDLSNKDRFSLMSLQFIDR